MISSNEIENTEDVIDSRDVIARIKYLDNQDAVDLTEEETEELAELKKLATEAEQYAEDWDFGTTLIRNSYFTDYCKDFIKDVSDMPQDIPPYIVIDWEATAENLKVDYTTIDFAGVEYLIR